MTRFPPTFFLLCGLSAALTIVGVRLIIIGAAWLLT